MFKEEYSNVKELRSKLSEYGDSRRVLVESPCGTHNIYSIETDSTGRLLIQIESKTVD